MAKKLKLSEGQITRLAEMEENRNRFNREVTVMFDHAGLTYKGGVESVEATTVRISYVIEPEIRSWGYNGFNVHSFRGESKLTTKINYFGDETTEDVSTEMVELTLDWDNVTAETLRGKFDGITVGDKITISLVNQGEAITSKEIKITVLK